MRRVKWIGFVAACVVLVGANALWGWCWWKKAEVTFRLGRRPEPHAFWWIADQESLIFATDRMDPDPSGYGVGPRVLIDSCGVKVEGWDLRTFQIEVAMWLLIGVSGVGVCGFGWLLRRRVAVAAGPLCLKCGYNLTGNVSGRCSECGEAVVKGLEAKSAER